MSETPTNPDQAKPPVGRTDAGPSAPAPERKPEVDLTGKPVRRGFRAQMRFIERDPESVSRRDVSPAATRITQGDILRDVSFVEDVFEREADGIVHVPSIVFPSVIVLTQACDLEQDEAARLRTKMGTGHVGDHQHDKWMLSALVAPLYNAEHFFAGTHLKGVGLDMLGRKGSARQRVEHNMELRYHWIEFPKGVQIVPSVVDFKHYFSANIEYLRAAVTADRRAWTVPPPWREAISQRFAAFLTRVGLPEVGMPEKEPRLVFNYLGFNKKRKPAKKATK